MQTLSQLQSDIAAEDTAIGSILALITGLQAQISGLKTSGTDATTATAIDALATDVSNQTASLAAAVLTNTPVVTPVTPPVTVTPAAATATVKAAPATSATKTS
jgi:hypothetical protein